MTDRRVCGLTIDEIAEIINSDSLEETVSEDQEFIDIAVCPPEADHVTDEDEGTDDAIGTVEVHDVPGTVELHYVASVTSEKSEAATSHPSTPSSGPKRKSKIRLLTDEESDWLKCNLSYTRLPPKGSDFQIKREELKTRLSSLSPKDIFEVLETDKIYDHTVKEIVRYVMSVKNEQDFV
jgi:hypothetical protein